MSGRDATGRFAPGFSPDRGRGRPAATPPVALNAALRNSVLMVAKAPTVVRSADGRRRTVPLFEALLLRLGTGQTSRRSSPSAFLRLVIECAAKGAEQEQQQQQPVPTVASALPTANARLDAALLAGTDKAIDDAVAAYLDALSRT